jgi:acyl-CoA thioester hydrolase/thioesterase-3
MRQLGKTRFSSELQVRPDDIDMNQHVHASRYFDYVLAARYDQMERCYKMGMDEFLNLGLAWFVRSFEIEYKRPLRLGEWFVVTTWVEAIEKTSVDVAYEITRLANGKEIASGMGSYTLVKVASGRAEVIPEVVAEKYSV